MNCFKNEENRVFKKSIRVCIDPESCFFALRTYSRERGYNGRFLISQESLLEWYESDRKRDFFEKDLWNILEMRIHKQSVMFRITWLSSDGNDDVKGFQQLFKIPESKLRDLLYAQKAVRHLHYDCPQQARIHTERAAKTLRVIQSNPLIRRAFIKAMRDCFQWRDEDVYLYPDFSNSFYFKTRSGFPTCGGLILHRANVSSPIEGQLDKYFYSVHT